ncbi:MAG: AAA family ATPase [Bacteroidetes bacterium]|nr:AAA family ATPase [Bacteroidota bacterium]
MRGILKLLNTINYWEKNPGFTFGYSRRNYLESIVKSLGNKLIKVIVGQRRCGKSYIIRQLIDYLINETGISPKNIFYLNKELYEFDTINSATALSAVLKQYEKDIKPDGKIYVFIDEVQDIADWEKIIVSLV